MNELRNFNEIFRKDVTYDNIKGHKKVGFHPHFRRHIFGKVVLGLHGIIENIHHFVVSSITYNSRGCEHIVQNDNFISVIFLCFFNFAVLVVFLLFYIKKM